MGRQRDGNYECKNVRNERGFRLRQNSIIMSNVDCFVMRFCRDSHCIMGRAVVGHFDRVRWLILEQHCLCVLLWNCGKGLKIHVVRKMNTKNLG